MSFSIHGVSFPSRTAAAQEMVANGMSIADAARDSGLMYQTVYVTTVGVEKTARRLAKYRAIRLAMSFKNYSLAEIGRRVGMSSKAIRGMLDRENVGR